MANWVLTTGMEEVEVEPGADIINLYVDGAHFELEPSDALDLADMLIEATAGVRSDD